VVDTPHFMIACWLGIVAQLPLLHEVGILLKSLSHHLLELCLIWVVQFKQTPAKRQERQFVRRAVVYTNVITE
jgi:hypothetical protein